MQKPREWRLIWILTVLALLALLTTLSSASGHYIADNHFEWFWAPLTPLTRMLTIWDPTRGLGSANPDFFPAFAAVLALFRGAGLSPGLAERFAHATLLTLAGAGTVLVIRAFVGRIGWMHPLAAFVYMFNPFTASFLIPSDLFLNYALAPWLLLCVIWGLRQGPRWRWAAGFALIVFGAGLENVPGLLWAALPLVAATLYLVLIERSTTWARAAKWICGAAALSLAADAAGIAKLYFGSAVLAANLSVTEKPAAISLASSWAESWRGLGFWLSYWIDSRGVIKPETELFFSSRGLILATFVLPCIALAVFWKSSWRPRLLFMGAALLSLAAMVGIFPPVDPSGLGRLLLASYNQVPGLSGFRNTYKAGPGLLLGVSVLVAYGVAHFAETRWRSRTWLRMGGLSALIIVIGLCAYPFFDGHLYQSSVEIKGVPSYYRAAFQWLDHQPGSSRVLVLPTSAVTLYRWGLAGSVDDDIVDALLHRPHIDLGLLPQSNPEAANVVAAINDRINSGTYEPGMLAAIAKRIGVQYVLIRNDLNWQKMGRPRPAALSTLRNDPELQPVAGFGQPGQNVVAPFDNSQFAESERKLPPVQIFRVSDATSSVRIAEPGPSLLVSGDGYAWPQLAATGNLDTAGPVRYTGDVTAAELTHQLQSGSRLVVTDSNRRQGQYAVAFGVERTYTYAASTRPSGMTDLFNRPGSQTTAVYGDASSVTEQNTSATAAPANRPGVLFSGGSDIAWLTGAGAKPSGALRIDFKHPTVLSNAQIVAARPVGVGRVLSAVTLRFSDGTSTYVSLAKQTATVDFRARRVRWVEIELSQVSGGGIPPVGLSKVAFPGTTISEALQLPDDVFRAATKDTQLRRQLVQAPIIYQFERLPEEQRLSRRFRELGTRGYSVLGTVRATKTTPDQTVDSLLGQPVGAFGSDRYGGQLSASGQYAVDGNLSTGWSSEGATGSTLTVRVPSQPIHAVAIVADGAPDHSVVTNARVTAGGSTTNVVLTPTSGCESLESLAGAHCYYQGVADLGGVVSDSATVEVTGVLARPGGVFGVAPLTLNEVSINGRTNAPISNQQPNCQTDLVQVDGVAISARVLGTPQQLLSGQPTPLVGCQPVTLKSGWHTLTTTPGLDLVQLTTGLSAVPSGATSTAADVSRQGSAIQARVSAPSGSSIISGQSYDPSWKATANGQSLGAPISLDTQSAWTIPTPGTHVVAMTFRAESLYNVMKVVTGVGLAACLIIIFWPRRYRRPRRPQPRTPYASKPTMHWGAWAAIEVLGALLLAGVPGAIVGLSAALVINRRYAATRSINFVRLVAGVAFGLLVFAAVASTVPTPTFGPGFAQQRSLAAEAASIAGVLVLVSLIEFARREHSKTRIGKPPAVPDVDPEPDPIMWRPPA